MQSGLVLFRCPPLDIRSAGWKAAKVRWWFFHRLYTRSKASCGPDPSWGPCGAVVRRWQAHWLTTTRPAHHELQLHWPARCGPGQLGRGWTSGRPDLDRSM
jgi:hypothetical protein